MEFSGSDENKQTKGDVINSKLFNFFCNFQTLATPLLNQSCTLVCNDEVMIHEREYYVGLGHPQRCIGLRTLLIIFFKGACIQSKCGNYYQICIITDEIGATEAIGDLDIE